MALAVVDICNMALARIGSSSTITALTDGTKAANACNRFWETSRDEVTCDRDWDCARARAVLVQSTAVPAFGFKRQYALPANPYCLLVREVFEDDRPTLNAWRVEGRMLLTDFDGSAGVGLNLAYTARLADPGLISAWLFRPLYLKLAANITYLENQSNTLKNEILQEYQLAITGALQNEGMQKHVGRERMAGWSGRLFGGVALGGRPWRAHGGPSWL